MLTKAKLVSGLNTKQEMWFGDSIDLRYDTNTEQGFDMWRSRQKVLSKTGLDYLRQGAAAGSSECKKLVDIGDRLGLVDFTKLLAPRVLFEKPMGKALRKDIEGEMERLYRSKDFERTARPRECSTRNHA